jgi:hypothetical protein
LTASAVLTAKQELVLRPSIDIDKYKKLVLSKKSGRTDHKMVRTILMEIAVAFGVASDFGKYDKGREIRRRLVEVADSMTDTKVAKVRKGVKLTGGKVDKGMITDESVRNSELEAKVDDLTAKFETLVALMTKQIAS